jgi:hypothetical protein
MATLVDLDFASDVSGLTVSAGTVSHVASEGPQWESGYASIAASTTAVATFSAVSSGILRCTHWLYDDSTTDTTSADTYFYLLPDATVSSTNSGAVWVINRNSGSGVTWILQYRAGSLLNADLTPLRNQWNKVEVLLDISARTFSIYFNDVLVVRNAASANGSFTSIDRWAVASQGSAGATLIDDLVVESAYTAPSTSTLIDHDFTADTGEIEASTPDTDARNPDPQPWVIPTLTSGYGGFTLGANGAAPDASAACLALCRGSADSIIEGEFQTSVAGVRYLGITFRFWDYPSATGAGSCVFRISSSDGNATLSLPNSSGVLGTVYTSAVALSANTTYTLRVQVTGRFITLSYKAAAMDSGSYTTLTTYNNTQNRGMLSEELCGPIILTTVGATDNYCRRFRVSGIVPPQDVVAIGNNEYEVGAGSIRSLAASTSGGGTTNVFFSKGIQFSHRSRMDGIFAFRKRSLVDATNCKVWEQKAVQQSETNSHGVATSFVTLFRRGPWVADNSIISVVSSDNFTPDWDLRGDQWDANYRYIIATGSASTGSNTGAHDWSSDGSSGVLPRGFQKVTAFGSGDQLRVSQIGRSASTSADTETVGLSTKWEQTGDANSLALNVSTGDLTAGQDITIARAFLIEQGSSLTLDNDTLSDLRDDIGTPDTLSFTTGSAKTDATGDYNTDGFNERFGRYEITCDTGEVDFTLSVPTDGRRFHPVFRLWSYTAGADPSVTIAGSGASAGTDYVIDDLGDGTAILQILSDRTADTDITLGAGGSLVDADPDDQQVQIQCSEPALGVQWSVNPDDQQSQAQCSQPSLGVHWVLDVDDLQCQSQASQPAATVGWNCNADDQQVQVQCSQPNVTVSGSGTGRAPRSLLMAGGLFLGG